MCSGVNFIYLFYFLICPQIAKSLNLPRSLMSMWSLTFSPQPEENEEEIQTAFLDWLHAQSHEPLACLTPRSGNILLHGADGDSFLFYKSFYKSTDGSMINIVHLQITVFSAALKHHRSPTFFFLFIAKLEFALTVLKPEAERDPPDQLFLLAPAVIQKQDVQVPTCMPCKMLHMLQCLFFCA